MTEVTDAQATTIAQSLSAFPEDVANLSLQGDGCVYLEIDGAGGEYRIHPDGMVELLGDAEALWVVRGRRAGV